MRKLILLLFIIPFIYHTSEAQKKYDFATVDALITLHYTTHNWDSVIYYGKAALADSIDYFYLRKHLGEAYYYKMNYLSAIPHFEKALQSNSGDIATQEFLYYSYLFSGRENDALCLEREMKETALKEVNAKKTTGLDALYLEAGTSLNNNFLKNQNTDFSGKYNVFGTSELSGNLSYGHLGMKIFAGRRFSFYIGAGLLNEKRESIFDVFNVNPAGRVVRVRDTIIIKPLPPPPYQTHDTIYQHLQVFNVNPLINNNSFNFQQKEFYLNCNIHVAKGFDVQPFVHLLSASMTMFVPIDHAHNFMAQDTIITHTQFHYPNGNIRDTVFYNYPKYNHMLFNYNFTQKDTSFLNYSIGFSLTKRTGHFNLAAFITMSNLNNRKQREFGASLTWFPMGNLNLYFNGTLYIYGEDTTKQTILNVLAGIKIINKLWLEGYSTFGNMNNFTEASGFVVNNNPDIIKFRVGLRPMIILKKFDIIISYQFQAKQGFYFYRDSNGVMNQAAINYTNQLITGGIKWKL